MTPARPDRWAITTTDEPSWSASARPRQQFQNTSRRAEARRCVRAATDCGSLAPQRGPVAAARRSTTRRAASIRCAVGFRRPQHQRGVPAAGQAPRRIDDDSSAGHRHGGRKPLLRAEDEGLVTLHKVPVRGCYLHGSLTGSTITERHTITLVTRSARLRSAGRLGERGQPLRFPGLREGRSGIAAAGGCAVLTNHLQKLWLFWSSTRGSGNDIFQATLAPRFKPERAVPRPEHGFLTLIPGRR